MVEHQFVALVTRVRFPLVAPMQKVCQVEISRVSAIGLSFCSLIHYFYL